MRVTTKKEEVGFVPTSFTITVESYKELLEMFTCLGMLPEGILDDLYDEVNLRIQEEEAK